MYSRNMEILEMANITPTADTPRIKTPALSRQGFKLREFANNAFRVIAGRGVTVERLTDPDYWSLVAQDLHPFDTLHVIAEDRSFYAELLVVDCGRGYAACELLLHKPLAPLLTITDRLPPGHELRYAGPESQWQAIRLCDGVVIGTGFSSRDACLQHLLDHASLNG